MPRQPRIDIPGLLQHVIFRGVARCDIFLDDEDREDFVRRLSLLLAETETRCYAWTLLKNHAHLLLMPTRQQLAPLMLRLLTGYAVSEPVNELLMAVGREESLGRLAAAERWEPAGM